MKITYRVDKSMSVIASDMRISMDELRSHIADGMGWYTHIWNNSISEITRGRFVFKVGLPTTPTKVRAWAWLSGNTVVVNRYPISTSTGQQLSWASQDAAGLQFLAAHEVGHALVAYKHITNPPYYGDRSYGHVMAISSYTFMGSFSPYEVWLRKYWGIRKDAMHPFVRDWLKLSRYEQAATPNLDKLLKIVGPYYQLGLHPLVGVQVADDRLKALPKLKKPIITP